MKFIDNLRKKRNLKKVCSVLSKLQSDLFSIEYDNDAEKLVCTLKYDFNKFELEKSISRDWIGNIVFNLIDEEYLKEMLGYKRIGLLNNINSIEYNFGDNIYLSNNRDLLDNIIIRGNCNVNFTGHYKSVNSFIISANNIAIESKSKIDAKEDVRLIAKENIKLNDYTEITSENGNGYIQGENVSINKSRIDVRNNFFVLEARHSLDIMGEVSKKGKQRLLKSYINAKNLFVKSRFSNIKYTDISAENELKMKFGKLDISDCDVDALSMDIKSNKIENRININFLSEKFMLELKRGKKLQTVTSNNYLFNNKEVAKKKKTPKVKAESIATKPKETISSERNLLIQALKDIRNQSEEILNEQIKNLQCRACSKVMKRAA